MSETFYIVLSILLLISLVASNVVNKMILDKALTSNAMFMAEIDDLKKKIDIINAKAGKEEKKKK
jgi:hypothetical protein